MATNSYKQPNQWFSRQNNPARAGQMYKKIDMVRIMPHFNCINGKESPGVRFWDFARSRSLICVIDHRSGIIFVSHNTGNFGRGKFCFHSPTVHIFRRD